MSKSAQKYRKKQPDETIAQGECLNCQTQKTTIILL